MTSEAQELFKNLVNNLEDQVRVYRHLLETVRREKEILISAHLDDMNENNKAKEAMLVKLRQLESERLPLASEFSVSIGLKTDSPRLLEMANMMTGETADRLRNIHSVLELLVKRVQEYNRQNEVLVQSALANITGAMKSIRESLAEKPTYKRQGDVSASASAGQLVSREA